MHLSDDRRTLIEIASGAADTTLSLKSDPREIQTANPHYIRGCERGEQVPLPTNGTGTTITTDSGGGYNFSVGTNQSAQPRSRGKCAGNVRCHRPLPWCRRYSHTRQRFRSRVLKSTTSTVAISRPGGTVVRSVNFSVASATPGTDSKRD